MRHLIPILAVTLTISAAADGLAWRGVWEWSLPKKTEADLTRIADSAQDLGFNVVMMSPPAPLRAFMRDQCHQRGMKLYLSTVFAANKPEWAQVMLPEEHERAKLPLPELYMHGGEPVLPGEVFNTTLPCYNRPEVREHFRQMVIKNACEPVDGLAFDYTGHQNYRRCYCPVCETRLADFRRSHPRMTERQAAETVAEDIIVEFTDLMAAAAREANPQIELTIHIYPWFAPNPYYGHKTDIDVVGQTVSWFFRPHWPLEKVRRLTENLVRDQHRRYRDHKAAPFIAFDPREQRNYRSANRLRQELRIIKESGAQALHMAELGYLLSKPLVAQAVKEELAPQ